MVKWAIRLGHQAWLVISIYHDGEEVIQRRIVEPNEKVS